MTDPMANRADDWLDEWKQNTARRLEESQMMVARMEKLKATVTSTDGKVTVTVNAHGIVTDLKLREDVKGDNAERTQATIMSTMAKARNELGKTAAQVVKDTVGHDSETGKAIMAGFRKRLHKPGNTTPGTESERS